MSTVKIEGGVLSIDSDIETRSIALVAERQADAGGPTMRLRVLFDLTEAIVLHRELGLEVMHLAGQTGGGILEVAEAEHAAVFGDGACPEWVQDSLKRYVDHGIPTGDCLRAILANDLQGAFQGADLATAKAMPAIVGFIHRHVPSPLHGNYAVVDTYISDHVEQRRKLRATDGVS